MSWNDVSKILEGLIKERIKSEGLYKTGRMYNSIKVRHLKNKGFEVDAVDYFQKWNKELNIVSDATRDKKFLEALLKQTKEDLTKELMSKIKK